MVRFAVTAGTVVTPSIVRPACMRVSALSHSIGPCNHTAVESRDRSPRIPAKTTPIAGLAWQCLFHIGKPTSCVDGRFVMTQESCGTAAEAITGNRRAGSWRPSHLWSIAGTYMHLSEIRGVCAWHTGSSSASDWESLGLYAPLVTHSFGKAKTSGRISPIQPK